VLTDFLDLKLIRAVTCWKYSPGCATTISLGIRGTPSCKDFPAHAAAGSALPDGPLVRYGQSGATRYILSDRDVHMFRGVGTQLLLFSRLRSHQEHVPRGASEPYEIVVGCRTFFVAMSPTSFTRPSSSWIPARRRTMSCGVTGTHPLAQNGGPPPGTVPAPAE